jgi:hypothetical protein
MILDALKAVHQAAGVPPPAGLARRVSELAAPEQLAALLTETWPHSAKKGSQSGELEDVFLRGMLSGIPESELMSAKELKVAEQIEGNLSVAGSSGDTIRVRRGKVLVFSGCNSHPATG